jgi:response regulator RpfG family c-di-GMP phosphodiesterase
MFLSEILKVLIADDEEEISEILSFIVKSSLKCDVEVAFDGKSAIERLSKGDISLIICDYNMPFKNGGDVYNFILESMPSCKYVMCSSDAPVQHDEFKDQSSFYGYIEKPNLSSGTKAIINKIKSELPQIPEANIHDYTPISPQLLLRISEMPSDVFLKLSEDKFVKVFNEGAIFDELDLLKYGLQDGSKLYTFNVSADVFITRICESIFKTLNASNSDNKVEANLQVHFLLTSAFKEFGLRESLIPLVDVQIKEAFELCKSNKSLSLLFDRLLKSKESYLSKHSFMVAAVSVSIAEKMTWNSTTTGQKLVVASMFHDIFLKETSTFEMLNVAIETRDEDFLSHSQKASELLDKVPGMPPDTSRIVREHHEVGEGEGFPRGISISKTSPLSQLFTFSHYVVDLILDSHRHGGFDKDKFYKDLDIICKKSHRYPKILESFHSADIFK